MKRSVLKLIFLMILLCGSSYKATALTNIVVNGSLDTGDGGWRATVSLQITGGYIVTGGTFWQDLATVPGRDYIVRFGIKYSMPRLHWGSETFTTFTNTPYPSTWQHVYCFVHATSSVTRLMFEAVTGNIGLDNILVGWLDEPATLLTQPQNRSSVEGGSAGFSVEADGGPPLFYQWFHESVPIPGATNHYLVKHELKAADSGSYHVIASNRVNAVTSVVAALTVDSLPKEPQIVLHPESDEVPAGYWYTLRTAAMGTLPLSYQWFLNGAELAGATNSVLGFGVDPTNAGTYTVRVSNQHGSALSVPAALNVFTVTNQGGYVYVNTHNPAYPAYDVDGYTRLGSNYVAQMYVGRSPARLRAVGNVLNFLYFAPGCVLNSSRAIPDVPPGELAYGQLRVWERAAGTSYEEARARGGKFGFSEIVSAVSYPPTLAPSRLPIGSFSLRYGLPEFTTGKLEFSRRLPDGTIEWRLTGEPGFRYFVEKRLPPQTWQPLTILTNDTGQVTFTDPDQQNASIYFYRSRMLE